MATRVHTVGEETPIRELLRDLTRETTELVRQEIALARIELAQQAGRMGRHAIEAAIAGSLVLAGGLVLLYMVVMGLTSLLATVLPVGVAVWLAPLIIGGGLVGVGALRLVASIQALRQQSLKPEHTLQTFQENKQWITGRLQ